MKTKRIFFILTLVFLLACNIPLTGGTPSQDEGLPNTTEPPAVSPPTASEIPITAEPPTFTAEPPTPTFTPAVVHTKTPSDSPQAGDFIYDVESVTTAPEKRAPYGDSYNINRLERPFSKDMTYIPDLDISNFSVSQDVDFFYVSIDLIGADPNNAAGIHYGVELDKNSDGFGDHIIWASPPYTTQWDTANVKIYSDTNHDTGGLSGEKSDAPISTNGYDSITFNGGNGDTDPDLAWVRINASGRATIQFAFKSAWSGSVFMLGVIADAGLKDPGKLDYVDRFKEEEAGSPVKDKKYYPLKELYAVDTTCMEAFGFKPNGYEPKLCPREPAPTAVPGKTPQQNCSQYSTQASCQAAGCKWLKGGMIMVYYYCAP